MQGVCFGAQLVGLEYGGKVGRAGCWELGARRLDVACKARQELEAKGAAWAQQLRDGLVVHEVHQDQVRRHKARSCRLAGVLLQRIV
jgi:GMP synthase-like glutamine amidotransferase